MEKDILEIFEIGFMSNEYKYLVWEKNRKYIDEYFVGMLDNYEEWYINIGVSDASYICIHVSKDAAMYLLRNIKK